MFAAYNAIGIRDGQSPATAPVRNFAMIATPAAALAPGGEVTVTIRTDASAPFIVARLLGSAKLGAVVGASPIGTPLPLEADADDAANTMPFLDAVSFQILTTEIPLQQAPRELGALAPRGGLLYTPPVPWVIAPDSAVIVRFKNNHATATILPRIEFDGYFDPRTV